MREKTGSWINCKNCNKLFYVLKCKLETKKYCSMNCRNTDKDFLEKFRMATQISAKLRKGKPSSSTTKFKKGHIPWNKGMKMDRKEYPNAGFSGPHTKKTKRYLSKIHKGKPSPKKGIKTGPLSQKHKDKISKRILEYWDKKGRVDNKKYRRLKYRQWRKKVYERDNYICQSCGAKSGDGKKIYLNAHHLKSWSEYPELRYNIDNGITLCYSCHQKIHNNFKLSGRDRRLQK